jgi:hypothetical protein
MAKACLESYDVRSRRPCRNSRLTIDGESRPQGEADSDFRRPLRRGVRLHSVETQHREYQCEGAKEADICPIWDDFRDWLICAA